jgi:hypothetical protein
MENLLFLTQKMTNTRLFYADDHVILKPDFKFHLFLFQVLIVRLPSPGFVVKAIEKVRNNEQIKALDGVTCPDWQFPPLGY